MIDERIESIQSLRKITLEYINTQIDFFTFFEAASNILGSTFDPFDWTTEDLDTGLVEELKLYSKFTGGEFGEYEDFIPKKEDWKYGESEEKFGWIDKEKYRKLLEIEYSQIELKQI